MKRVTIEKYRGIEIEFDLDDSKFISVVTDGYEKESKSHKAVRKFIDDYKKENDTFKSFYVHGRPGGYNVEVFHIIGVRKDGAFLYEGYDKKKYKVSSYNEADLLLHNEANDKFLEELKQLNKEFDDYKKEYSKKRKDIIDKMNLVSLKEYREFMDK